MHDPTHEPVADPATGYLDALISGDFSRIFALYDECHSISTNGTSRVSGSFERGADFIELCFAELASQFDASSGECYLKSHRIACRDRNAVIALANGGLPLKNGRRYDQRYGMVWRVYGGKIHHTYELIDPDMVETVIYGQRHRIQREKPASPFEPDLVGRADNPGGSREASITLAEAWLEAVRLGEPDRTARHHHADLVANIVGWTPYSGRWFGLDAYCALPFDFHADPFAAGTRQIGRHYNLICADENAFFVLLKGRARTKEDRDYRQHYGVLAQVLEGRISELHIWLDTVEAEDKLFDNPIVTERLPMTVPPFDIY